MNYSPEEKLRWKKTGLKPFIPSPEEILRSRRRTEFKMFKTLLFDYTAFEYRFVRETDYLYIKKLVSAPRFLSEVDPAIEYQGKNKEMYKTVGEFYTMSCVKRIFDCRDRATMNGWIDILP